MADCSELAQLINDIAMLEAAEPGVATLDNVVERMQGHFPQITRQIVVDSINEVTAANRKEIGDIRNKIEKIRREAHGDKKLSNRIEALRKIVDEGGTQPEPKSRPAPTQAIAELRAIRDDLMKQAGRTDATVAKRLDARIEKLAKRLESGDIAAESRNTPQYSEANAKLASELRDLQKQISVERQIAELRSPSNKAKTPDNAPASKQLQELIAERDALRSARRESSVVKSIEARIAELQSHLDAGTLPETTAKPKNASAVVEAARGKLNDVRGALRKSDPAKAQQLEAQIAELEQRVSTGDVLPKTQPETELSAQLQELTYRRDRLQQKIRRQIQALKPKTVWERVSDPFNAIRAIMTSFDVSAVARQGGFILFSHPIRAAKSIVPMFRAMASEKTAMQINNEILSRENAPLYARSKLYIAPLDGTEKMSGMEEAFMSRLAEKIPGIRASERAYITFLNKLRADSFDAMVDGLAKNGSATQAEMQAVSNFINVATGRGNLGSMDQSAVVLNTVFFAPRYVASRFQLLLGQPMWRGPNSVRKAVALEYARYLAGISVVYLLGYMAGGELEDDPRSSDFGKIRFGNTRLDPLSGLSQVTTLIARTTSGKTKNSKGKLVPLRGDKVPYGGDTTWDVLAKFARTKLSPMAGMSVDAATGKDVVGQPVTLKSEALDTFVPISMQDIYSTVQEQGVPKGAALSVLSLFGASVQTYGKKRPPQATPAVASR
jgi:hypothetical protein